MEFDMRLFDGVLVLVALGLGWWVVCSLGK